VRLWPAGAFEDGDFSVAILDACTALLDRVLTVPNVIRRTAFCEPRHPGAVPWGLRSIARR
jgi:hypothetical protein